MRWLEQKHQATVLLSDQDLLANFWKSSKTSIWKPMSIKCFCCESTGALQPMYQIALHRAASGFSRKLLPVQPGPLGANLP